MQLFCQTGSQLVRARCWESSENKVFRKLWQHLMTEISKYRSHTLPLKHSRRVSREHGNWAQGYTSSPEGQHVSLANHLANCENRAATATLLDWVGWWLPRSSRRKRPSGAYSLNLVSLHCIRLLAQSQLPRGVNTKPLLVHKTTRWHDWLCGWFGPVA